MDPPHHRHQPPPLPRRHGDRPLPRPPLRLRHRRRFRHSRAGGDELRVVRVRRRHLQPDCDLQRTEIP